MSTESAPVCTHCTRNMLETTFVSHTQPWNRPKEKPSPKHHPPARSCYAYHAAHHYLGNNATYLNASTTQLYLSCNVPHPFQLLQASYQLSLLSIWVLINIDWGLRWVRKAAFSALSVLCAMPEENQARAKRSRKF